jgi:outer membrane receptor protein involved in Fe transport
MPNLALFALLVAAGAMMPGVALGQGPMDVAMAGPQPHFVAAWAPEKEREAEHSAALARRVSLELENVSLDAALKALTNEAGLRITYSKAVLPAGKRVTIKAGDIAVITALTEILFRSGLDVVVDLDGALALVRCKHLAPRAEVQDSGTLVGTVTDKATGSPLAGATVALEGTPLSASTNSEGQYRFARVEAGTYTARARYIGYAVLSTSVTVAAGEEVTADFGLEKSTQKLDELVTVTPGGMQTEVKALPSPISVISADEIERQHVRTLPELMRQLVPGMVSFDVTARPENSAYSVRGASTLNPGDNQMKVVVDGVQLAFPAATPIDPNSIERIEVIRGPQAAAVYGSDAVGGVIQIFTKRGDATLRGAEVGAQLEAGAIQTPYEGFGSVLRQAYTATARGGGPEATYDISAGYTRTGDWLPDGEISSQSNPSINAGARWSRGPVVIELSGRYGVINSNGAVNPELLRTGFVDFSAPQFLRSANTSQAVGARLSLMAAPWWSHSLTLGVDNFDLKSTQERQRFTTPEDTLLSWFSFTTRRSWVGYNSSFNGRLAPAVMGSLQVGFDYNDLLTSSVFTLRSLSDASSGTVPGASGSELSPDNTGLFAQGSLALRDKLFLTSGLRAEWNEGFGDSLGTPVSPRVGISYVETLGNTTLKLRGSWGRAIRPPPASFRLASGTSQLPNPELGPERQRGWDAGVDLTLGQHASLSATYYHQTAENLIQFVQVETDPVLLFQWQNAGRVQNRGVELEGSLGIGWLELRTNYAYTQARIDALAANYSGNLSIGDQVPVTPKHTAGVLVTVRPRAGTSVNAGLAYVGSFRQTDFVAQFRCFGGSGPCPPDFNFDTQYPGFAKLNLTVSHQLTRQLSGFVEVDNLTNNTAVDGGNIYPVMGRMTMVGVRFQS